MDRHPLTTEIELALLLQRTAAQDPAAFRTLYDKTAPILFARLLRMLPQRSLAEEALQLAYVRIWESAAQHPAHRGQPMAWLLTAARYCALDLMCRGQPAHDRDLTRIEVTDESVPNHFDDDTTGLSAEERRCLALAFVEGLSPDEIARLTANTLESVKREIRGGLLNLRTEKSHDRRAA